MSCDPRGTPISTRNPLRSYGDGCLKFRRVVPMTRDGRGITCDYARHRLGGYIRIIVSHSSICSKEDVWWASSDIAALLPVVIRLDSESSVS